MGHLLLGDLNVHSRRWLGHSNGESAEGTELNNVCNELGLSELVRTPTRRRDQDTDVSYLLDLCLSSIDGVRCKVLPPIADHSIVEATLKFKVPSNTKIRRKVWCVQRADWDGLKESLRERSWLQLDEANPSTGAEFLARCVLEDAGANIPQRYIMEKNQHIPDLTSRRLCLSKLS